MKSLKNLSPEAVQVSLIIISCLFAAVMQGAGFLSLSHYTRVLVLTCIFLVYFGLLFI